MDSGPSTVCGELGGLGLRLLRSLRIGASALQNGKPNRCLVLVADVSNNQWFSYSETHSEFVEFPKLIQNLRTSLWPDGEGAWARSSWRGSSPVVAKIPSLKKLIQNLQVPAPEKERFPVSYSAHFAHVGWSIFTRLTRNVNLNSCLCSSYRSS
jgi:hypothetical protein